MARGARWHVIQGEIPLKITSVSGGIYEGYTSTVTLQIDPDSVTKSKATAANVLYWVGGVLQATQSNVALPASGTLSTKTPAAVFNLAYDTVVDVTVQNATTLTDGKGKGSYTIWQMPYGGSKYEVGDFIYHKFTGNGDWVNTLPSLPVWYLVVSGGAGGSGELGAGGGAGGAINTSGTFAQGTYPAVIGGGGGGGNNSRPGTYGGAGGKSSFNGQSPNGGGAGGFRYQQGRTGGSGGGCGSDVTLNVGAGGTSGQGNAGGKVSARHDPYQGGGGGGKGGVGAQGTYKQATMVWPDGGAGITWHDGQNYAGGGGGCGPLRASGTAGNSYYGRGWGGTAGNGCKESVLASHAPANRGGGGGGGSNSYVGYNQTKIGPGSNGGSGVVVVRFQKPQ